MGAGERVTRFAWTLAVLLALPAAAQPDKVSVKLLDRQSVDQAAQPGTEGEPIPVEVVEEEEAEAGLQPGLQPEQSDKQMDEQSEDPAGIASKLTAGAWCVLATREDDVEQPAGDAQEETLSPGGVEESIGCDGGVAASLIGKDFRQGRLSLVGVLGVRSLGVGAAWTFGRQGGHPLSVAIGVVMPYSGEGVFAGEAQLAIGATMAIFGRR